MIFPRDFYRATLPLPCWLHAWVAQPTCGRFRFQGLEVEEKLASCRLSVSRVG